MKTIKIALIGNPNCGKTTLFNALTGGHQKVGNWPGVTVEKKSGAFHTKLLAGQPIKCEIVDLPGIYSLEQSSFRLDEKIARDYLLGGSSHDASHISSHSSPEAPSNGEFDVIINIVDAGNLQRNLVLTQQLLEIGKPCVVALNMLDVAAQQGISINTEQLAATLGLAVAPIIASRQEGLDELLASILAIPELNLGEYAPDMPAPPAPPRHRHHHQARPPSPPRQAISPQDKTPAQASPTARAEEQQHVAVTAPPSPPRHRHHHQATPPSPPRQAAITATQDKTPAQASPTARAEGQRQSAVTAPPSPSRHRHHHQATPPSPPRHAAAMQDQTPAQASPTARAEGQRQHQSDFVSEKLLRRYHRAEQIVAGVVQQATVKHTVTERIDAWILNKWLGLPIFLLLMYLMFTIAINLGAVFIDFFDIFFGAAVVETPRWMLESMAAPAWLMVLLADGLGGGIQLVATFIPVIGFLFLCLSVLEASGYMSRAAFVVDRLMSKIGLPGNAFVPLIVGFGCNVPAVMATRSLGRESDRLLTIAMAPFMSCGARLTVYALFAAALFPDQGQNIIFALYLLGVAMAVLTGWLFRKQIFDTEVTPSFQEMPSYHLPVLRNILLTSWFRMKGFIFRAGKTIVLVVIALSFLNSMGTDGSFGNEDSDSSVLAIIGKSITPVFAPIGLQRENWPATVGLFTGLFAKEAVVGTLDALYSREESNQEEGLGRPDMTAAVLSAVGSIGDNLTELTGSLGDPLGIRLESSGSIEGAAAQQGVTSSTLTNMASMFDSRFAAFCYLVFILLYAPCVAVLGATAKEAGLTWMLLMFFWTTGLAYVTSSCIYQAGTFASHPGTSSLWLLGSALVSFLAVKFLKTVGKPYTRGELIRVVQVS